MLIKAGRDTRRVRLEEEVHAGVRRKSRTKKKLSVVGPPRELTERLIGELEEFTEVERKTIRRRDPEKTGSGSLGGRN